MMNWWEYTAIDLARERVPGIELSPALRSYGLKAGNNEILFPLAGSPYPFLHMEKYWFLWKKKPLLWQKVILLSAGLFSLLNFVLWMKFLITLSCLYVKRTHNLTTGPVPSSNLSGFYSCFSFISGVIVNTLPLSNL